MALTESEKRITMKKPLLLLLAGLSIGAAPAQSPDEIRTAENPSGSAATAATPSAESCDKTETAGTAGTIGAAETIGAIKEAGEVGSPIAAEAIGMSIAVGTAETAGTIGATGTTGTTGTIGTVETAGTTGTTGATGAIKAIGAVDSLSRAAYIADPANEAAVKTALTLLCTLPDEPVVAQAALNPIGEGSTDRFTVNGYLRQLLRLRWTTPALDTQGSYREIEAAVSGNGEAPFVYERTAEGMRYLIIANRSDKRTTAEFPLTAKRFTRLAGTISAFTLSGGGFPELQYVIRKGGRCRIVIQPTSAIVLRIEE